MAGIFFIEPKVCIKLSYLPPEAKLRFFVDLYGKCEEEYQKLPNKFLVEYSK